MLENQTVVTANKTLQSMHLHWRSILCRKESPIGRKNFQTFFIFCLLTIQGMNPKLNRRARLASCKRVPFYGVARQEKVADDIVAIVARLRPALSSHRGNVSCWKSGTLLARATSIDDDIARSLEESTAATIAQKTYERKVLTAVFWLGRVGECVF